MKHKHVVLIVSFFLVGYTNAQTTVNGSFVHDGITRTYSFYVPTIYTPGLAVPMVIGLHGTSSSGTQFAQYRDFRPIADTANFIMVHPDGTTLFGQKFWNYGNVFGSTVDDVGFIEALIDTISAHYTVNQNRIYCAGMSNGGFMTYYLACQTNRFAAIGSVTGSMGTTMYNNCNPVRPTPSIHVHGTSDPTNPYAGNSTSKSIPAVTRFWVNQNSCDTTPVITQVPNTNTSDGSTAERHLYSNGINNHTVEHFKVTGGEHTWPGCPMPASTDVTCMDFDARIELWRFFRQYEINRSTSVKTNQPLLELNIWPNPAQRQLHIEAGNRLVTHVTVTDMQGGIIREFSNDNIQVIDLGYLNAGCYIAKISGKDFQAIKKLIIRADD
ncbi:MAG: PHB depolymerase family esterase [Bacteroidota bacterium]